MSDPRPLTDPEVHRLRIIGLIAGGLFIGILLFVPLSVAAGGFRGVALLPLCVATVAALSACALVWLSTFLMLGSDDAAKSDRYSNYL